MHTVIMVSYDASGYTLTLQDNVIGLNPEESVLSRLTSAILSDRHGKPGTPIAAFRITLDDTVDYPRHDSAKISHLATWETDISGRGYWQEG